MKNRKSLLSTHKLILFFGFILSLVSCNKESSLFRNVTPRESGVDFENKLIESDSLNILDYLYFYNGGGAAIGDINNDGLPDLFFSSNQHENQLYLNTGNLRFKNISKKAAITGNNSWNTGAIMADVNGDGWLDIYVTAVVGINNFTGHNELYINNQDNTFSERSKEYNLDFQCYGTTAAFFDYDLDGDLDLYVLNHAVHTENSFGKANVRNQRNDKTGDKLLRNDGGTFTDVSEIAGIYGGINGYGLGLSVSDFNKDGYPDLYIGNDFHEDDYYYLNNGDGTFTESLRHYFGHTSRFSMGNDAADINHDGKPDLISLDMAPQDETVLKSSEGDDTYQTLQLRTQRYGYHYQYTRNMLFTNNTDAPFTESALLNGVAATDWSWSALFNDYNMDGHQDLFISNGIPKRPNDLDFIRFVSSSEIQKQMNKSKLVDQQALEMMPSGAMPNYLFYGNGTGHFKDVSKTNTPFVAGVSGATAVGDLDNDGDLDMIINNLNAPASLLENTNTSNANYLKIQLRYKEKNLFGIGSKVYAYTNDTLHYRELFPNKGWQSSSEPTLHFGLGSNSLVDSIRIVWPDNTTQLLEKAGSNKTLFVKVENASPIKKDSTNKKTLFSRVGNNLGIDYVHMEDMHSDFDYQKLIPYEVSKRGPAVAVGDFSGDGKDDIFLGGAKNQRSVIYRNDTNGYSVLNTPKIWKDSIAETIDMDIMHLEKENALIGLISVGGNSISPSKKVLSNQLLTMSPDSTFTMNGEDKLMNTGVIKIFDNPDSWEEKNYGPLVFEGNYTMPLDFGKTPVSFIKYTKGKIQKLEDLGMVTDAIWDDFDGDGQKDLIVIGEWMSPTFFRNDNGSLYEVNVVDKKHSGLWQTILPFDIDEDGDTDYLLGNWGLNSKLNASLQAPLKMYYADFDKNGSTETILASEKQGNYYPLLGLNELSEQLVYLRKKFNNYHSFAGKTMKEVFSQEVLDEATLHEVNTLSSGFLRNNGNTFTFESFPTSLQTAPIKAFTAYDFNGDGKESVLAGGNYFGVIPFHGRFDSFSGALIHSENNIELGNTLGLSMEHKSVRHLEVIQHNNQPYLLIIYNNDAAQVYSFKK